MTSKVLNNSKFWEVVNIIDSYASPMGLSEFLHLSGCDENYLLETITFINEIFNLDIHVEVKEKESFIVFPHTLPTFDFKLNFKEWLSLQYIVENQDQEHKGLQGDFSTEVFKKKFEHLKHKKQIPSLKDIDSGLEIRKEMTSSSIVQKPYLKIQQAMLYKQAIAVKMNGNGEIHIYPHRFAYFDKGLHIVGEDCQDRCLVYFSVSEIEDAHEISVNYRPCYTAIEVCEFVESILSLCEDSLRLVLKIKDHEQFYGHEATSYFMGRPFVTENGDQEKIWAATVEANDQLFDWLDDVAQSIEILDPQDLKEQVSFKKNYKKAS